MTCKSRGSDRCGNHAACERRGVARRERVVAWTVLWLVVGIAEDTSRKIIARTHPIHLMALGGPEAVRRECGIGVLQSLEQRTR